MLNVDAAFELSDLVLPRSFEEARFSLLIGERTFTGGPDTRFVIEQELDRFLRSRRSRHWGSFYGIEEDYEAIVNRVVYAPGDFVATVEALSAYSMFPRLSESEPSLEAIGIACGDVETLLIRVGGGPVERFDVDSMSLEGAIRNAIKSRQA